MGTVTPLTEHVLRTMAPPEPDGDSKDGRGCVLLVAGCTGLPGAILLSAHAAMRVGAGKLQLAVCRELAVPIGIAVPEALVIGVPQTGDGAIGRGAADDLARRAGAGDAILVGPGMSESEDTQALVAALVGGAESAAVVLDAGALGALRANPDLTRGLAKPAVITPHAGEMARLLDMDRECVEADPLAAARRATERFGTTVMKGGRTHVVSPDDRAWCY